MQPTAHAIVLSGIQVYYNDPGKAVLDVDRLTITQGERVALIGSSGAGKTTLLRLINGYLRPATGSLRVLGCESSAPNGRRSDVRVGFIFQNFNLIERATVFENVLWGRLAHAHPVASLFGHFSRRDKEIAMQAVDEVALGDQIGQRCDTLSGGQQQRVAIARVLAQEPEIILADEPVSSLDPALADDALNLLLQVSKGRSATLVMSLHQPDLARGYADRIIGLRAGRVVLDERAGGLGEAAIATVYEGEVESAPEEP